MTARTYVERLFASFDRTAQTRRILTHDYHVADRRFRTVILGEALQRYLEPALAHIEIPLAETPDLTISLWDGSLTGEHIPPYERMTSTEGDPTYRYRDAAYHIEYHTAFNLTLCIDFPNRRAAFFLPNPVVLPSWAQAFPLRTILNSWLRETPFQLTNAAAVGFPEGGVLIVGVAGAGKSVTALACLESPLQFAGDSFVLTAAEPTPMIYSLYSIAMLDADGLTRFPRYAPHALNKKRAADEEALIPLAEIASEKLIREMPLRAVLMPRLNTGAAAGTAPLIPAMPTAALAVLAPSTAAQVRGAEREGFAKLATLVKSVPCYILEVGSDLTIIPPLIIDLLLGL
ncbi:MAG TPA: hypothetical protein PLD47_02235 [Aggregatilineales bacterium]|nr:hypothetical protein [Anaerolineales bacterium]HRE46517.1 hypothetical protein [Aggregatilineales bacterium]